MTWLHPLPLDLEDGNTFREVLAGFEADLSLYRLEENALSKHAVELHLRTGGYFKALAYVVSTAAVIAIRTGNENVTMKERRTRSAGSRCAGRWCSRKVRCRQPSAERRRCTRCARCTRPRCALSCSHRAPIREMSSAKGLCATPWCGSWVSSPPARSSPTSPGWLQRGVHILHFEHRGHADEFSYHSPR